VKNDITLADHGIWSSHNHLTWCNKVTKLATAKLLLQIVHMAKKKGSNHRTIYCIWNVNNLCEQAHRLWDIYSLLVAKPTKPHHSLYTQ